MGLNTKIEYLRKGGSTHNFWLGGCEKKSEGCRNCFAERIYKRFYGKDFSKPILSKNFDAPLKWKKPRVILVNDMSDFFHTSVDIEIVRKAWDVMGAARQHIFLLLTKRPKNIYIDMLKDITANIPYEHIWLGVSVENQRTADERIPELLKIPHFKKWLSVEPMLESIKLIHCLKCDCVKEFKGHWGDIRSSECALFYPKNWKTKKYCKKCNGAGIIKNKINWIVAGGETGRGARHLPYGYLLDLLNQCKNADIPFFMKQMSNKAPIPKDLLVREYPKEMEAIK